MSRAETIPRDKEEDYSPEQATRRREFATAKTGARLDTVGSYSIDPAFPRLFPWFAEGRYWDEHIQALNEQTLLLKS